MICMSEPREVRFSCGHAVCCRGCAEGLLALGHPCPTCRTTDISTVEIGTFTSQPTYVQQRRPTQATHQIPMHQLPQLPGLLSLGAAARFGGLSAANFPFAAPPPQAPRTRPSAAQAEPPHLQPPPDAMLPALSAGFDSSPQLQPLPSTWLLDGEAEATELEHEAPTPTELAPPPQAQPPAAQPPQGGGRGRRRRRGPRGGT